MFASFSSMREPKKKKSNSNRRHEEQVVLPLPIPLRCANDKNLENVSKLLSGDYTAHLRNGHIRVCDEWAAKTLYNCGYFGHGEFSRGEPSINSSTASATTGRVEPGEEGDEEEEECSLRMSQLAQMTAERYENRRAWLSAMRDDKAATTNADGDFHAKFVAEFVDTKRNGINVALVDDTKYCRVNYADKLTRADLISIEQGDDGSEQRQEPDKLRDETRLPLVPPIARGLNKRLGRNELSTFAFKIKKTPACRLQEHLVLMHEEAFFLCFGLDCLSVEDDESETCLTIGELWKRLCHIDADFPFKYAVYHKLRSKGWIVKNGLKYGCHFLTYFHGPDKYHASFSIIVKPQDMGGPVWRPVRFGRAETQRDDNRSTFAQFSALLRLNEAAGKDVMMCYVIYDSSDKLLNFDEPSSCLPRLSVLETTVSRWVPKENRDAATSNTTSVTGSTAAQPSSSTFENYMTTLDSLDD